MLVNVTCPVEPFNSMVRKGTAGKTIARILEAIKPEHVFFTEKDGERAAVMVVEIPNASAVPSVSEPWFLNFDAACEFHILMTADDLMKANLEQFAD